MQKVISSSINSWIKTMDSESKKHMGVFLASLSDQNIHMLHTKKSMNEVMELIYDGEQDLILESLYMLRYHFMVNDVSDDYLKELSTINNSLSESILFTNDLKKILVNDDPYSSDVLYSLIFIVRANIVMTIGAIGGDS